MIEQTTIHLERKRPFTLPTLIILLVLGSTALLLSVAALFVTHTAFDQIVLPLAQVFWRLVPTPLWFGAILVVAIWLLTLRRVWRDTA